MCFITCCKSSIRTGIFRKIQMPRTPKQAAAACSTIARRVARSSFRDMSAPRSPVISRKPETRFARGSKAASRSGFGFEGRLQEPQLPFDRIIGRDSYRRRRMDGRVETADLGLQLAGARDEV